MYTTTMPTTMPTTTSQPDVQDLGEEEKMRRANKNKMKRQKQKEKKALASKPDEKSPLARENIFTSNTSGFTSEIKPGQHEREPNRMGPMSGLIKSATVTDEVVTDEMKKEYLETALKEGQALWDAVKKASTEPDFATLPDNKKIDRFSTRFHPFNKEFPIVSRYLICMGQYSSKAFKRYLLKVQNAKHPAARDKGYMEDQWVCRQADYVRYLWESYQRGHYDNADAKAVWNEAYKTLRQEFIDFRTMHEKIEKKLDTEKKVNKEELVSELMGRLSSGEQTLGEDKMRELLEVLKIQLFQQRKEKLVIQISEIVPLVPASCEAFGTAPDLDEAGEERKEPVDFPR